MSYTLEEVSEKTGRPQATLRKLIQRGQLHVEKEGNRTFVTEEALESFMAAEVLEDIADEVRDLNWGPARQLMDRLPDRIRVLFLPRGQMVGIKRTLGGITAPEFRPAPKPSAKKKR